MEKSRLWFTADPHFGHDSSGILRREMRPFATPDAYAREQVRIWNAQAAPEDTIYVIGDFCNVNADEGDYRSGLAVSREIRAHVVLIIGNQEERVIDRHFGGDFGRFRDFCLGEPDFRFADVVKNAYVTICGRRFFLTHRPTDRDPSCLNLYGHTHRAGGLWKRYGFNVGTDLNHFRLFGEEDIAFMLSQKDLYWDADPDSNCF